MGKELLNKKVNVAVSLKYGEKNTDTQEKRTANIGTLCEKPIKAYIYGIKYPLKRFLGTVIAVGIRSDGSEFVVVANEKMIAYDVNLKPFLEKFEKDFKLICAYEKSCGAVIFKRINGQVRFLLVLQGLSNSWSFPKGHINFGENEHQTASREIKEEVGIRVKYVPGFRVEQYYRISNEISKKVVIFLATTNSNVKIDNSEIIDYAWIDENTAPKYIKKRDAINLIRQAKDFITENNL